MPTPQQPGRSAPDVLVVGTGIIGLTSTLVLARRGARVTLIGTVQAGAASPAAAGMLAPSVERMGTKPLSDVDTFAFAARDYYPDFLADLRERSGLDVPFNRRGILDVALNPDAADRLRGAVATQSNAAVAAEYLDPVALADLEPALGHAAGAVRFPHNGAVETRMLLRALATAVANHLHPGVRRVPETVRALAYEGGQIICETDAGLRYAAPQVVLAAGAWTPRITGLPVPLPVVPVRGQIVAFGTTPGSPALQHVVYGPQGYLVPRDSGVVLAGSTMEKVGFDASITDGARAALIAMATTLCPPLGAAPVADTWAGLRPVTPDLAPIIGRDVERPGLVYACGHSRNGILLGPLTGACVAALCVGDALPADIAPFGITRF